MNQELYPCPLCYKKKKVSGQEGLCLRRERSLGRKMRLTNCKCCGRAWYQTAWKDSMVPLAVFNAKLNRPPGSPWDNRVYRRECPDCWRDTPDGGRTRRKAGWTCYSCNNGSGGYSLRVGT